ncbi:cytochrome P450 [Gloeopeniophorella convolvens]|nr:cytochrome P450 [Gloeopeniophorella convolvens]
MPQSPLSLLGSVRDILQGLSATDVGAVVVSTSFISHLCFRYFEPRSKAPLFTLLLLVPTLLSAPILFHVRYPLVTALPIAFTTYDSLLVFFTVAYRLSPFHPLAKHPGPAIAKVSKLWAAYISATGETHRYLRSLHDRYGDVVRTGPNELSIREPSLIHPVLGQGGIPKGTRWESRPGPPSLIAQRDPVKHMHQRKPWNRAFSSAALKEYEVIVAKRVRQLVSRLDGIARESPRKEGVVLDIGMWLSFFTTDFMGDMAFGGGFELVRDGEDKVGIWTLIESGLRVTAVTAHTAYANPYFRSVMKFLRRQPLERSRQFGRDRVMERLKAGAKRKDLFYYLSGEDLPESERPPIAEVAENGGLAIVAGSDTTSSVLGAIVHFLLRNPEAYEHLQKEVDAAFPTGEEPLDVVTLSRMEWLNGCIGSPRKLEKGKGAKVLGNLVIPEETQVFLHTYSMHRDPRNFHNPDAFLPERWLNTGAPAGEHNTAAFIPFSYGPAICAGKYLALLEMRMVLCWMLRRFRFSKAPGVSYEEWEECVKDWFVVHHEPLQVELSLRV